MPVYLSPSVLFLFLLYFSTKTILIEIQQYYIMTADALIQDTDFNPGKFAQVLHYIISKTDTTQYDNVGKKVLFKLLYFNDFNYYERTETKMTGETYLKWDHGPAPRDFNAAIKELKKSGMIEEKHIKYHGYEQVRYRSLKPAVLTLLSAVELQHIDDTLGRYATMNGSQIEATSHKDLPWIAAKASQVLDYEMVFYRSAELSVREYD